ncbi:MAG TPA: hypothetical protein VN894_11725, partial [Polyangiaceae bacterium]|nr:hypothetical protein [Polyangiaceae bacterium]
HLFSAEELRLAAQRAWHTSFSGGEGSVHCVAQSGTATLLKAGPHLINFFYYPRPYIDNPGEQTDWLPQASQRQAWIEHFACVGVDYMNEDVDVELGYCVLSKLVAEMLDGNCTGVYVPRESTLIPNDDLLYGELQKIASSRESGVSATP